jgi:hypothetical protein
LVVLGLVLSTVAALAQDATQRRPEEVVNWAYAVGDTSFLNVVGQSVQVVRLPIGYSPRSIEDDGWGLKLSFPVSFGFHELTAETALGGELRENVGTVAAVPGAEFRLPVGSRWTLRPFVEAGAGKDMEGGEYAWIYSGGLNALFVAERGRYEFRVGPGLAYDGATLADRSLSSGYTTLETGFEVRRNMGRGLFRRNSDIGVYAIRRRFLEPLEFEQLDGRTIELRDQTEIGFSFGLRRPLEWWLMRVDRVGIGWKSGGKLSSVRLLFDVPF